LRPESGMATFEASLGDGMQVTGAPIFSRHSNPMDTELEINLMDELTAAFHLPEEFRFLNGGLGIININENDTLLCLYYSARLQAQKQSEENIRSDKFIIYFPNSR